MRLARGRPAEASLIAVKGRALPLAYRQSQLLPMRTSARLSCLMGHMRCAEVALW